MLLLSCNPHNISSVIFHIQAIMCGRKVMVMVMVMVMTQPVGARIYTECDTYDQSSEVPQPLEMNKIGEGVLESRFQLLSPPPDNTTWATVVHIMNQEDNHHLARLEVDHTPGRQDQVNLICSATSNQDSSSVKTITGSDAIIKLIFQDFILLRVGCSSVYYNTERDLTYPLSFSHYKWKYKPHWVKKQGEECWIELSVNTDEENQILLEHKCPINLSKLPHLQMAVKCPHGDDHCAPINFCNIKCESVSSAPVHCQEVKVSNLDGYREPLHYDTTCPDNGMEVELVLTPPSRSRANRVRLELGTHNINNTPVAWIDFIRYPLGDVVDEYLWFRCVQDHVSRVVTKWSITKSHTNINIFIQVTKWWMKVYQQLEGESRLVTEQHCPGGVEGFPYNKLKVLCYDGGDCGDILSLPNIPEYTKIPSPLKETLEITMKGRQVQNTSLTFKGLPDLHHWSIQLLYSSGDDFTSATVTMSHTPNNTMGELMWLLLQCDLSPPDSIHVNLYRGIPSSTAPPRYYKLQSWNKIKHPR